MSDGTPAPPTVDEVLVLMNGMARGMPIGPTLKLADPDLHISVYGGSEGPPGAEWAKVPTVVLEDLPPPARAAVDRMIAEHVGDAPWPARRPPWFRRGWLPEVDAWIDEQLRALSLARDGATVPVRAWSLSAVLRVPLAGDTSVWFKATCDHFRTEPAITRAVSVFAPATVPTVLATDDDRAWMLLAPLPPTTADRAERIAAIAQTMARLQLAATAHIDALRAAGCPDRGRQPTLDAFRRLLDERDPAPHIWPWVKHQLETFFGGDVPPSLVHGDFHPNNVAGDQQPVIYDWTDGCISHPFLDGAHLANMAGEAHHAVVREAYLTAWGAGAEAIWDLAPVADLVFQAVTHEAIRRSFEPASQWEVSSETDRLFRELEQAYRASR